MRKQKKTVLWPVYLDSSRTRKQGRRVPKSVAVSNPNVDELKGAIETLGLEPEVEIGRAHPATPWQKTGRIWLVSDGAKGQTLMKIAREVALARRRTER